MSSPSPTTTGDNRLLTSLRKDTVGGGLLVIAALTALIWANSPLADSYFALRDVEIGFAPWHLQLSLGTWAADGLLAIFFFLVGVELKTEFTHGDLRSFRTAIVPITAAAGGVIVPALIYTVLMTSNPQLLRGWAIPTATDIAFAVAILAIIGSHLPKALRIFLLTLAAVDDLLAIGIIAVFYTETINPIPLLAAVGVIIVYGLIASRWRTFFVDRAWAAWVILLPLGLIAWGLMHASGIHATIAGVALGFTIPALARRRDTGQDRRPVQDETPNLAEVLEHRLRPLSAGFAVPVFAFFAAGVAVGGFEGLATAFSQPLTFAIIAALVLGKPLGILASTWLVSRFTSAGLDPSLKWLDLAGVGLLAGIGFTVSLLVAELSFIPGSPAHDYAKVAILSASVIAALLATLVLGSRNRRYRKAEGATLDVHQP
ncbi:MAG: Na+/H+ antiporter NhaA [Brevibacterium aurantiacum]|uniref:Na(+)/H(+) antiporter NhaA n=1 Tax=Brevibacterium aurantiacum TaxID=273384 RepID=A0A1D7W5S2_BREAU|nr:MULTISPECIES: Na+/H+ antiporter NhaA [Brevibacterium]MDN5549323.1 Na+/H+ antiporter NhaA [Brevibacterium sp.]AOP54407.1 Na+/H+ antiporter NhaA type [Brevibacterium aurantiacum]AZL06456.1 Na+/H+ antiporter NhaA [Brevibacterium aurantiacum]AZL10011.1 Na+/H+ antiporter NhaA [Brevibacterium aurantiacum]AZT94173.1 Na+/H+ antiporter NhaA [Brevibacterium aurantiacum]